MLSRKQMKLITIITLLSIFFSALLPHSTSLLIQEAVSGNNYKHHLSLPPLPRKLRFTEKVQEYAEIKDLASQKDYLPAVKQYSRIHKMMAGMKKSKQAEWKEEDNPSKYFTMDYHNVRKRPPIHNKHFQDGP